MTVIEVNSFTARPEKDSEPACPYCNIAADICMAFISSLLTDMRRRKSYCDSEGYGYCPIFLAKNLRRR